MRKKKEKPPVIKDEGNCPTWAGKSFRDQAMENHVLYRQELEQKKYKSALEYWEKVFSVAPAADGQRDYQYSDGVKIYKGLLETENNAATKEAHINRIFELYELGMECYPAKATMYKGLKAYDLFYTFPGRESEENIYQIFKAVVDVKGEETPALLLTHSLLYWSMAYWKRRYLQWRLRNTPTQFTIFWRKPEKI